MRDMIKRGEGYPKVGDTCLFWTLFSGFQIVKVGIVIAELEYIAGFSLNETKNVCATGNFYVGGNDEFDKGLYYWVKLDESEISKE